jgi:hypothetical protein
VGVEGGVVVVSTMFIHAVTHEMVGVAETGVAVSERVYEGGTYIVGGGDVDTLAEGVVGDAGGC